MLILMMNSNFSSSNQDYVFLCNGPNSYSYHFLVNCKGLKNCSTIPEKTSLQEALRRGRKICGFED